MVQRIGQVLTALPECPEAAWVGTRWRIREAIVKHVFGCEDPLTASRHLAELVQRPPRHKHP
jgi:hypothetical protein